MKHLRQTFKKKLISIHLKEIKTNEAYQEDFLIRQNFYFIW